MKKFRTDRKKIGAVLLSVSVLSVPVLFAGQAMAQGVGEALGLAGEASGGTGTVDDLVKNVISLLLFVIGIVSVIMIIVGGIMYATSSGAAEKAKTAKNTILYSVVGLVVAIFAYAIVQFVYSNVVGGGGGGGSSQQQGGDEGDG